MDEQLVEIFKKAIGDQQAVKNDIVDYLVKNGGNINPNGNARDKTIEVNTGHWIKVEDYCQIACLLANGKKIPAIKMFREITGCGLKEAKDAVEAKVNWPV